MRQLLLAPITLALAALALPSHAVTLKIDGYKVGNTTGSGAANSASNQALSRTMGWQVNSISTSPTIIQDIAGQFGGSINDGTGDKPFAAYCTELSQGFNPFPTGSLTYTRVDAATVYSNTVYDRIGRLYSEGIVFDTAEKTAACAGRMS